MKLEAKHIELSYGDTRILKDMSLQVGGKEFVGIIGPNGSGKSTLLKCIYRVLQPQAGCVWLEDKELKTMSYKASAKKLAVVAQHNYYNFDFSVREVVLMGRAPHKKAMERDNAEDYRIVEEALETVGMKAFTERSFASLSGGEQQRVILARALAQQTPCLILDEPTNHLDITHQLQLLKIVRGLEVTVVSAIHDLNIAAMFCNRIFAMKDGEILKSGSPREVLTSAFIRQLYQVDSEVVEDSQGNMHILFY